MIIGFLKKYDFYFALICISFAFMNVLGYNNQINSIIRLSVFPLLIMYYFKRPNTKNWYLLCFLISYWLGELSNYLIYIQNILAFNITKLGNISYILGYVFLILLIFSKLNLKKLVNQFLIQILILSAVGTYLFLELNVMVFSDYEEVIIIEYLINGVYNLVIVVLLGLSLLHYFYHDSKIALKLLIACSFLVFSEFAQTAFYFMGTQELINKIYTVFLAISYFYFFLYIKAFKKKIKKTHNSF